MKLIKESYLVALDSAIIGDISHDFYHKDDSKRKKARLTLNEFYKTGAVPVITWHHIEELIAHRNNKLVSQSIRFLQQLPIVCVLKDFQKPQLIGSIIDIDATEIDTVLNGIGNSISNVIVNTKEKLFRFCSGSDLFHAYEDNINILREIVFVQSERKKEIASISRAQSIRSGKPKISDLHKGLLRSPEEAKAKLKTMQKKLEVELRKKGDKKLKDAGKTAADFINSVICSGNSMYQAKGDVVEHFLKPFNISPNEIKNFKTLDQIKYLAIYKKRLDVIARKFDDSKRSKVLMIREENCPSWLLWRELHKIRCKAERASGSDLNDSYLACLSYYVDLTVVDKRTHEYLGQITRKSKALAPLIKKFVKVRGYGQIASFERPN